MINETMRPRERLFDRIFSILPEIKHPNNSTKLADMNSIMPASSIGSCYTCMGLCCKLHLRYKQEAEHDSVVRHSEYSETAVLDSMEMDELLVGSFCMHLDSRCACEI